jgi:hypothetical protein
MEIKTGETATALLKNPYMWKAKVLKVTYSALVLVSFRI